MWLVVLFRLTTIADGTTLPTAERAYLTCTQPRDHPMQMTPGEEDITP